MKVLILGGTGMLGHKAWQVFKDDFDTYISIRGDFSSLEHSNLFSEKKTLCNVDALNFASVENAIAIAKPDAIINCIGIIKQSPAIEDTHSSTEINSIFPKKLSNLCAKISTRLICLSTDCVFSGERGNYSEKDPVDPVDFYGMSKALGEVSGKGLLTIRTSVIGDELNSKLGLFEWFLDDSNKKVEGFSKAIYTGFTTLEFSKILAMIIDKHAALQGLYHISSAPISKYDLLRLINKIFELNIEIEKDESFVCDRSLNSSKFRKETNYLPPSWPQMIAEMAKDFFRFRSA